MTDKIREEFEAAWRRRYPYHSESAFTRSGDDPNDYATTRVKDAWWAWKASRAASAVQGEPEIEPYDAGSLNDFGGGDVGWWHDYIRAELDRAYEFYLIQLAAAPQPAPTTPTGGESDE